MAKSASVKASGMKHLIAGHYACTINGKQALVKLPHNVERPEPGADMNIFADWTVDSVPELSEVQKRFAEFVNEKKVGGQNANSPEEDSASE